MKQIKRIAKKIVCNLAPLSWRKKACVYMEQHKWLNPDTRYWWTRELLRDFENLDRDAYHRFLWSHHLGYANSYEVEKRFGVENMVGVRKIFFSELQDVLVKLGLAPEDILSVFEVGCSLGYQLRFLETDLCKNVVEIEGIDLDAYAIAQGNSYLREIGSKVRLSCGDMADMEDLISGKVYDIILCTGVLMYLQQKEAARVVETVMKHCRLAAFSGLAHPEKDNSLLLESSIRERDGSFIHNIDAMVAAGNGMVINRRWEGATTIEGQTVYFVFAGPCI